MLATINRLSRPVLRIMQTQTHMSFFAKTTTVPIKRYVHTNNADADNETRQFKEQYVLVHREFNRVLRGNYKKGLELYDKEEGNINHDDFTNHNSAGSYFNSVLEMSEDIDEEDLTRAQRIMVADACIRKAITMSRFFAKKKLELICWDKDYMAAKKITQLCEKAKQTLPRNKKGMEFEGAIYIIKWLCRRHRYKLDDIFDETIQAHYDKGVDLYEHKKAQQLYSKRGSVFDEIDYEDVLLHFNSIITMSKQLWTRPHWKKEQIIVAEAYLYKAEILFRICECNAEKTTLEKHSIADDEIKSLIDEAAKLLPPDQDKERLSKKFCKSYDLFISKWTNRKTIVPYGDTSSTSVLTDSYKDVNAQEVKDKYLKVYEKYNGYLLDNYKKGLGLLDFSENDLQLNELSSYVTRCYNQVLAEAHFNCVLTMSEGISEKNLSRTQRIIIAETYIQRAKMMSNLFENKSEKLMCWEVDNETRTEAYKLCEKAQSILPPDKKGLMFKKEIYQIKSPFLARSYKLHEMFDEELLSYYERGLDYKERLNFFEEEPTIDNILYENALYCFNNVIKMSNEMEEEELLPEQQTIIAEACLCKAEIISLVGRTKTWEERHKSTDEIGELIDKARQLLPPDKKGYDYDNRLDVIYDPFIPRWGNGEPLGRYNRNNFVSMKDFEEKIKEEDPSDENDDLIDSDDKDEQTDSDTSESDCGAEMPSTEEPDNGGETSKRHIFNCQ